VLGFSVRGARELHPVGAARLRAAAALARDDDVVVLSGWARTGGEASEAELMRRAWAGAPARLVLDHGSTHTVQNAAHVARVALPLGAREVVVVTSRWHSRRAGVAFRSVLRGTGVRVTPAPAPGPRGLRGALREIAVWPVFALHLVRSRARGRGGATPRPPG